MASKLKVAVKEKKEEATPEKDAPDTPDAPLPLLEQLSQSPGDH